MNRRLLSTIARSAALTVTLLLAACAARFPIADGMRLTLPAASVLGEDRYATQLVSVTARGVTQTFQADLELLDGVLSIVASDALGTPLFGIRHDTRTHIERYAPLESAPPLEMIVADLMLVYAPLDALASTVSGGAVTQSELVRTVHGRDGRARIRIEYQNLDPWSGRVMLEHLDREYRLVIDTVDGGRF